MGCADSLEDSESTLKWIVVIYEQALKEEIMYCVGVTLHLSGNIVWCVNYISRKLICLLKDIYIALISPA